MFTIDHNLLNEIGIDSQDRKKKFDRIQRKNMSLRMRMDGGFKV